MLVNFGFLKNIQNYFEKSTYGPQFPLDGDGQKEKKMLQCQLARSLTPHSVSLCIVTYFANISAKTYILAKPFQPVYQGPRWNTATLKITIPLLQRDYTVFCKHYYSAAPEGLYTVNITIQLPQRDYVHCKHYCSATPEGLYSIL